MSYVESPKVNQGWMSAEKPWQFLAACFELSKLRKWQVDRQIYCIENNEVYEEFGYSSHLECFVDGSNNGAQHLSALTRDEITAPHVNLIPLDLPGDLYSYVADHVWLAIKKDFDLLSHAEVKACENLIDTIADMKRQITEAPLKSDRRKELISEIIAYKKEHEKILRLSAPVFWHRITDRKHKRKIVKRGVMTISYGSTPYGMSQQIIDDARKHNIPALLSMEHAWGSYMGRSIFEDCKVSMKRPTQLLSKFEEAGKVAEQEGRFLRWTVPITNFPVVQHYTEGTTHGIYIQYGPPVGERDSRGYYPNTYKLHICFLEEAKHSKRKQSQGASPNAIHSLDAAHLTLAITRAPFPVTTIHDSFGCLLGDMASLFVLVRETFVELYNTDPLRKLMKDIGGNIDGIELGALDISLILDSEYAFA